MQVSSNALRSREQAMRRTVDDHLQASTSGGTQLKRDWEHGSNQ